MSFGFSNTMEAYDPFYYGRPQLQCEAVLQNRDLWKQFHELETEMIITKSGRRMFPSMRVQVHDLNPVLHYCVLLELVPCSANRYKYDSNSGWAPAGNAEPHNPNRVYLHPDSPATGAHWMTQPINFNRLKLTNSAFPHPGHVVLSSMHKYQPRIVIVQAEDPHTMSWSPIKSVTFPETQFIAVTAYQNDKITKLKIDNNPFAKGFREYGQARCKRKRERQEKEKDEENPVKKTTTSSDESTSSFPSSPELSPVPCETTATEIYSPAATMYQPPHSWYSYPYNHSPYKYPANYSVNDPVYFVHHVQPSWSETYQYSPYLPVIPATQPQDLSVSNQRPKGLTDFSIRAIMGS